MPQAGRGNDLLTIALHPDCFPANQEDKRWT